jgi:glutamate-ammonia-ligase adenylyltransferase
MIDFQALYSKQDPARELCAVFLSRFGQSQTDVAPLFAELWTSPSIKKNAEYLWGILAQVGDHAQALRCLNACGPKLFTEELCADDLAAVLLLAGASPRAARLLAARPALASEANHLSTRLGEDLAASCEAAAQLDTDAFERQLRRIRNRQMLAIALAELRSVDVLKTASYIAELAERSVRAALIHHQAEVCLAFGLETPPCAYSVIGMGKLGGGELNFSSDIDLLYFYAEDRELADGRTSHEFFIRLFMRMQQSLSQVTEDGFVFRVDTDLRPEGRKGPLANSLAGAERYYQSWGQTWERAAWIKARPIAGEADFGQAILKMMQAFVYRKSMGFEAIEEIVSMKQKVDHENRRRVRSRLRAGLDLKLGIGGIREIEFFVQSHQLLYGGRQPRLRHTNTMESLKRLESAGVVNALAREILVSAYRFLRLTEHRIQFFEDQQTHALPLDALRLDQLARTLGTSGGVALRVALDEIMASVHEHFSGLLASSKDEQLIPDSVIEILDEGLDDDLRAQQLHEHGARHPMQALASIATVARINGSPFHPRASARERRLAQLLMQELLASPDFDRAIKYLPDLIRACTLHQGFLSQLRRPALRRGIGRILGASDHLARILLSSPALLQNVLIESSSPATLDLDAVIEKRLGIIPRDLERSLGSLRKIKQKEILRIALADMADQLSLEALGKRLSKMAEVFVSWSVRLATEEMELRYGCLENSELVVLAGGSLGAYELGYRTDLDLGFIFSGAAQSTGGSRPSIGSSEYYTRLAQRAIQYLSMKTRLGDLYPVDMRLRPSGGQGALITSMNQFRRYHSTSAQLWERQALTRTRTILGPPALRQEIDEMIASAAYQLSNKEALVVEIDQMRRRLYAESTSGPGASAALDIKCGRGGLVEIEFIVQFLLLAHGPAQVALRNTSTRAALRALGVAGILSTKDEESLLSAHAKLRRTLNWLRLTHDEAIDRVFFTHSSQRALAMSLGYEGEDAASRFQEEIEFATAQVHDCYFRTFGTSRAVN